MSSLRGRGAGIYFAMVLGILAALSSGQALAQLSSASVNGVVRDPSGAVVPKAQVTLRNVDTSVVHNTATNDSGAYTFTSITPGRYVIEVDAASFKPEHVSEFVLAVSQIARFDFTLQVGAQNEVVTVESTSAQLEISNADLGTVIATKQVNDLPLNGRNFTQLLSLTPGVVPVSTGQNSMGGRNGGFSAPIAQGSSFTFPAINGGSNRSNFYLTDGLNNFGSLLSTYAVPPIIDAIQEFKVESHTDSAEFGSVLGGVVNVVTKSGGNAFHGSTWEYVRNDIFDARTYFLPKTAKKAAFRQNQFGGSAGGPVWIPKLYNGRNKSFFYGAYQGFRYTQTNNTLLKVPTAAQLAGDESGAAPIYNPFTTRPDPNHPGSYIRDQYPNNQITPDPAMLAYAKFIFPTAGPAFDSNGDNALDTTPLTQTQNEFTVRGDQTFGSKDSAWFRYSFINSGELSSGGVPGLPDNHQTPARQWGGSYVHIFNQSLIVQGQFGRTTVQDNSSTLFTKSTADVISQAGFSPDFVANFAAAKGKSLLPNPGVSNYANPGEIIENTPKATDSNQYSGIVTKTLGSHEFHIGGGYTSNIFSSPIAYTNLGFSAQQTACPQTVYSGNLTCGAGQTGSSQTVTTGDPLTSLLLNVPDNANRRNVNEQTRPGGVMSFFAQDSWKAMPKLTLNFGLRYDYTFIPPYGTNATIGQNGGIETGDWDFSTGTYIVQKLPPPCSVRGFAPCIPGDGTLPAHVIVDPRGKIAHNVPGNWGPRFGFAYRVTDKTVVRGAYGIVYDNWAAVSQMAQNIEGSWPDIGQLIQQNLNKPTTASPTPNTTAQNPFGNGSGQFPAPTPFNQVQWFYDPHIKNAYSEQWNFGVERQLNASTAITANYVGSGSHRVNVGGYYNTAITPGPGDVAPRSPYPYAGATFYDRSTGAANYNAFQFQLDKRYSNGLAYQVAYTWSKSIDEGGDGWFGAEGGVPTDPYNPAAFGSRSVSGTDLTHVLSVNTLFEVPIGRGKRFSTKSAIADYMLGNWQVNNIFSARSGQTFTPIVSSDIANTGNVGWGGYEHANLVGNPHSGGVSPSHGFNTAAYATPPQYTYGTAGRNSLRASPYWNLDTSLFKQFPVREEMRFEFRAEAFNLFNNVVLGTPNSDLNNGASFGTINSTANAARIMQLGAKFLF
jgi:Carboxypeptidase regulatory-like domain